MKRFLLWIGCFLIGYDYKILINSSASSARTVKKYFSAILIISILWGGIGYAFTNRYFNVKDPKICFFAAAVMIFIIIQIERQIILSERSRIIFGFRITIGVLMALIGSTIIDQIIFAEDVQIAKVEYNTKRISKIFPERSHLLNKQKDEFQIQINQLNSEITNLMEDVTKNPKVNYISKSTSAKKDSTGRIIGTDEVLGMKEVPNPKMEMIFIAQSKINKLEYKKDSINSKLSNLNIELTKEIESKIGFLDELNVLFSVIFSSTIAAIAWLMFFALFFCIEGLVLVNKWGDNKAENETDYDFRLKTEKDAHIKKIKQLANSELVKFLIPTDRDIDH